MNKFKYREIIPTLKQLCLTRLNSIQTFSQFLAHLSALINVQPVCQPVRVQSISNSLQHCCRSKQQRGATFVEFSLVSLLIVFFIITFFDFGRIFVNRGLAAASAQEGGSLAQIIVGLEKIDPKSNYINDPIIQRIRTKALELITNNIRICNVGDHCVSRVVPPTESLLPVVKLPVPGEDQTFEEVLKTEPIEIQFVVETGTISPWISRDRYIARSAVFRERMFGASNPVGVNCDGTVIAGIGVPTGPMNCPCPGRDPVLSQWDPNNNSCSCIGGSLLDTDSNDCECPDGMQVSIVDGVAHCVCSFVCPAHSVQSDNCGCTCDAGLTGTVNSDGALVGCGCTGDLELEVDASGGTACKCNKVCAVGEALDATLCRCTACGADQTSNGLTCSCRSATDLGCPDGTVTVPDTNPGECRCACPNPNQTLGEAGCTCDLNNFTCNPGFVKDAATCSCLPCGSGYTGNADNLCTCRIPATGPGSCAANQELVDNGTTCSCVNRCPGAQVWDPSTRTCACSASAASASSCSSTQQYNSTSCSCSGCSGLRTRVGEQTQCTCNITDAASVCTGANNYFDSSTCSCRNCGTNYTGNSANTGCDCTLLNLSAGNRCPDGQIFNASNCRCDPCGQRNPDSNDAETACICKLGQQANPCPGVSDYFDPATCSCKVCSGATPDVSGGGNACVCNLASHQSTCTSNNQVFDPATCSCKGCAAGQIFQNNACVCQNTCLFGGTNNSACACACPSGMTPVRVGTNEYACRPDSCPECEWIDGAWAVSEGG